MTLRALSAIRLSVKKDETTSPERQDQATRAKIAQLGLVHVGTASDLNVSASKVDPFRRPELGPWLTQRADEFDVVVWWRWDRAIRSTKDLIALIDWAQEKQKRLVFCEGNGSDLEFDFTGGKAQRKGSVAMIIANLIAWVGEVESQNVSDRVTGAHGYLRDRGEWGGGMVPYGFEPMRIPNQDRGWTLIHSKDTISVLKKIIKWVVDGRKSLLWICNTLNEQGVPSPRDAWDLIKERRRIEAGGDPERKVEPKERRLWNTNGLKVILTSRVLLGETEFDGKPYVNDKDDAVMRATPVVSLATFKAIQTALADRAMEPKVRYEDPNPLLGVAICARCGERYYMKQEKQKGKLYTSLSCRSRHGGGRKSCGQPTLSMVYATTVVNSFALSIFGSEEQMLRSYVPGNDRSEELLMWQDRVRYLKEDWDDGSLNDRAEYKSRLRKYNAKIAEIGDEVVTVGGYQFTGTGKTYQEVWSDLDVFGRLQLLNELGVKVYLGRGESPTATDLFENRDQADRVEFRRAAHWDVADVERGLAEVQEGRIKKDFEAWLFQEHQQEAHEVIKSAGPITP